MAATKLTRSKIGRKKAEYMLRKIRQGLDEQRWELRWRGEEIASALKGIGATYWSVYLGGSQDPWAHPSAFGNEVWGESFPTLAAVLAFVYQWIEDGMPEPSTYYPQKKEKEPCTSSS